MRHQPLQKRQTIVSDANSSLTDNIVPGEGIPMNKCTWFSKMWLPALLAMVFAAGCGGNDTTVRSSAKAITAYSLAGATGTINETAKTISVTVPNGTSVSALVATFTTTGAGVKVETAEQTSGSTANNFTVPPVYIVTAADGTTATYTVLVAVAPVSAKSLASYSLAGITGAINETAKTVTVTVPNGTALSALVATFTTTGSAVKVGTVAQVSGTTPNNFTAPVAYTVTAADGSAVTYAVTVTAAPASAKTITAYSLAGIAGSINEATGAIAVTVPNGTAVNALAATFATTGSAVKVGTVLQVSGVTLNNFTAPVTYGVTAADGTTATYTVTVTVAANSAKVITAYSLAGVTGTIHDTLRTIDVSMPSGTDVSGLIATFTTTGVGVKAGTAVQTSGTTQNNFTSSVVYTVTAADNSTALYTVTVTVAPAQGPAPVLLGMAGNYVILAESGVSTVPASAITGDIGLSPAATSYLTGFSLTMVGTTAALSPQVTGSMYAADMTAPVSTYLTTAVVDMGTAYTDAAGRPTPDFLNFGAGDIGGQTLTPGLYKWTTGVAVSSNVTLSGGANDVWIFQIPGSLVLSPSTRLFLSGGAQAKNIFWQVAGTVYIGTAAHFEGIILSQTSITLATGASMNGRALAQTAVILDSATVTKPD